MLYGHGGVCHAVPVVIGADAARAQRVAGVFLGEGETQPVLARSQVGQDVVALVVVVIRLGHIGVRRAGLGQVVAAVLIDDRLARLRVAHHPLVLAVRKRRIVHQRGRLPVAVNRLAVGVEQLHLHAVDAGVFRLAVVVEVAEEVGRARAVAVQALPHAGVRVDALVGGQQPAPVVGQVIGGFAPQAVLGQLAVRVVLQTIPVGVQPHVVANVAALGRGVHERTGGGVLGYRGVLVVSSRPSAVHAAGERVFLHGVSQLLGPSRIGFGIHVEGGIARQVAQVLGQIERSAQIVGEPDGAQRIDEHVIV